MLLCVPSNKVRVVIVLNKNVVMIISSSCRLSGESHTGCASLVKVRIVVATKTNRRPDRDQYTRSNAATARLRKLVKPAETLARD